MSNSKPVRGGADSGSDATSWLSVAYWKGSFTTAGFRRGFLTGYIAKNLMTLLPKLVRAKGSITKIMPAVRQNLGLWGDPVLYGLFFGGMNTVFYNILTKTEEMEVELEPTTRYGQLLQFIQTHRVAIAAFVSGLCLFAVPAGDRTSVSLFLFTHALEVLTRYGAQRGVIPRFCHADMLLMSLASMQVIWAWFHSRPSHDPSYLNFLDSFGDHPWPIMKGYTAVMNNWDKKLWPAHPDIIALNAWRAKRNIHPIRLELPNQQHVCDILHPQTMSCMSESKRFLLKCFNRSSKIYMGVYFLPLLLFRFKDLMRKPASSLLTVALSVLRSSAFLTAYCFTGWGSGCLFRDLEWSSTVSTVMKGFLCGFSVLIEKKVRRIELALYVLSHALRSGWRTGVTARWWPSIPHGEVFLCCVAMAVLLSAHIRSVCGPARAEGPLLHGGESKFFHFFFGQPSFQNKPYSSSAKIGLTPSASAHALRALLKQHPSPPHAPTPAAATLLSPPKH